MHESLMTASRLQVALDLEWYDQSNGQDLLEVGLAIQPDNRSIMIHEHYVINENNHLENRYAPTSSTGFIFGTSQRLNLHQVIAKTQYWLSGGDYKLPVDVILHDVEKDNRVLMYAGINVWDCADKVYDTKGLFKQRYPGSLKSNLQYACEYMGVEIQLNSFHDAGNDAAYTLRLFNKLVSVH
ncbi:hypothetical protein HDU76_008249 [Blyttiomyces sp. JEL0837]|nr:hypothetical protein HDU76_008249 [Blyttiomyces sp. JEL0837]